MRKKPYAQKLLPVIVAAVVIYTVAAFILQFKGGVEISPALTTAYFAFWGVEIVNLAVIKVSKEKRQNEGDSAPEEEITEESEG
jgi:hypothetical protein